MELSESTRSELRKLKEETICLLHNKSLYQEIFALLKSDLDFLHKTKLEITDDYIPTQYSNENDALLLNLEENYDFCKKLALSWSSSISREKVEDLTKELIFLTMFHEVTHGEQRACALEDYSPYREVNRFYRVCNQVANRLNPFYHLNYHFRGPQFSFERNANLSAYRELVCIGSEELTDIYKQAFLVIYVENYSYDRKVLAPALKTLHMMGKKYDFLNGGIPTPVLVEHGFALLPKDYNEYIVEVDAVRDANQAYQLCLKKLGKKE